MFWLKIGWIHRKFFPACCLYLDRLVLKQVALPGLQIQRRWSKNSIFRRIQKYLFDFGEIGICFFINKPWLQLCIGQAWGNPMIWFYKKSPNRIIYFPRNVAWQKSIVRLRQRIPICCWWVFRSSVQPAEVHGAPQVAEVYFGAMHARLSKVEALP